MRENNEGCGFEPGSPESLVRCSARKNDSNC